MLRYCTCNETKTHIFSFFTQPMMSVASILESVPPVPAAVPASPRGKTSKKASSKTSIVKVDLKAEAQALRKMKSEQTERIAKLEAENAQLRHQLRSMPRVRVDGSSPRKPIVHSPSSSTSSLASPRAYTAPFHVRQNLERLRQSGVGRVVELRVGRTHEMVQYNGPNAVQFNEGSIDRLKYKLEREGYSVLVRQGLELDARSVLVLCLGAVVGKSTYDAVKTNAEIARLASAAAEAHAKRVKQLEKQHCSMDQSSGTTTTRARSAGSGGSRSARAVLGRRPGVPDLSSHASPRTTSDSSGTKKDSRKKQGPQMNVAKQAASDLGEEYLMVGS